MLAVAAASPAQTRPDAAKQGEQVFEKSCATGYCHGIKGEPSGAPRLAGRGLSQTYITQAVTRGIAEGGMPSFARELSSAEIAAVVVYVASLNGTAGAANTTSTRTKSASAEAQAGEHLFRDPLRGFGRCSTCHSVERYGIPIAPLIRHVPASLADFKALISPTARLATVDGESIPVLLLAAGKSNTMFYDLSVLPPVQRVVASSEFRMSANVTWDHSSVVHAYNDADLGAVLAYLRDVISTDKN